MKPLNFNHLYYFMIIAKEGSVSKACKKLFITQPTLSGQLAQLEKYFGKKLFDRKNKKLLLNHHGELVLSYASEIFKLHDEMLSSIKKKTNTPMERVNIGLSPSLSKTHVHDFVSPLLKKKSIQVYVKEGLLNNMLSELQSGMVDLVLCEKHIHHKRKYFVSEKLLARKIIIVAHPKFSHLQDNFPQSLHKQPFISYPYTSHLYEEIHSFFLSENISPDIQGEIADLTLLKMAAESGNFITALPFITVQKSLREKKLITLGEIHHINSEMWIIYRKSSAPSSSILQTIEHFKKIKRA
ncbi:MAG: LysR family transcriptional regulator [Bdellovibrionota bacterium]